MKTPRSEPPEAPATERVAPDLTLRIHEEVARELVTPRARWIAVGPRVRRRELLDKLEAARVDQVPVLDGHARALGIASAEKIRAANVRVFNEHSLQSVVDREVFWTVGSSLESLLQQLEKSRAALVRASGQEPFGLISISDLSWPAFRSTLFPLFCEFEHGLARMITQRFGADPWGWVTMLHKDSRPGIVGHWEIARQKRVDTSATVGATLSQLLEVVGQDPELRSRLIEKPSRAAFDELTKPIREVRNQVAHPVRPLVEQVEDLKRVRQAVAGLQQLVERLRAEQSADR